MTEALATHPFPEAAAIAQRFVRARLDAVALPTYPGPMPADLESGYAVQDAAIALWPDELIGWKVGRIPPERQAESHADRLAGPIFRRNLRHAQGSGIVEFPAFLGGFAAVESEFVCRLGEDAPAGRTQWSVEDASALIDEMFIGAETACSPLPTINALGPKVIVSDFGNNGGLILGPAIQGWRDRQMSDLPCETIIEGISVGRATAASLPGGTPMASVAFLLGHAAARGRPLKAGQLISTGAATGVHPIAVGQSARVDFGPDGHIGCRAVAAKPVLETAR